MPNIKPAKASFISKLMKGKVSRRNVKFFFLCSLLTLYVSIRFDPSERLSMVQSDFYLYRKVYSYARFEDLSEFISNTRWEPIYTALTWTTANLGLSFIEFARLSAMILALTYCSMAITVTKSITATTIASALFVISPIFISLTEVIIRQGISMNFLFLAVISSINKRLKLLLLIIFAASLTHSSNFIVGTLTISAYFFQARWKFFSKIAMAILAIYTLNIPAELVGIVAKQVASFLFNGYNEDLYSYDTGFKLGFFIASTVTLLPSIYLITTRNECPESARPLLLLTALLTIMYIFSANLPFHDRIAIISWLFAPILVPTIILQKNTAYKEKRRGKNCLSRSYI